MQVKSELLELGPLLQIKVRVFKTHLLKDSIKNLKKPFRGPDFWPICIDALNGCANTP